MIIIFKKIPENTSDYQIEEFIAPALKGGLFRASGHIEKISFWTYEIVEFNTVEYYALVDIEPNAVGQRIINQLNKKQLNGKYIAIQEFHVRHWSNDKRTFTSVVNRGGGNKRKTEERRRKIVKIERSSRTENITISSHSSFWNDPNNKDNK
jgi:hypothetical protein